MTTGKRRIMNIKISKYGRLAETKRAVIFLLIFAETRVILGESTGADMDNKKRDLIVSFIYAIIGMGAGLGYFWV